MKEKGSRQKKPAAKFRAGVPAELADRLLKTFIQTVKTGLALLLSQSSELTRKTLKKNPLWEVSTDMNWVLVTWAAFAAWDKT
ncbi:MAG: hypothetical protein V3S14_16940 [Anaerolineae bacterium]